MAGQDPRQFRAARAHSWQRNFESVNAGGGNDCRCGDGQHKADGQRDDDNQRFNIVAGLQRVVPLIEEFRNVAAHNQQQDNC